MQYLVKWEIDIEADSAQEAAQKALEIQRDSGSEAVVFDVCNPDTGSTIESVDLLEIEGA